MPRADAAARREYNQAYYSRNRERIISQNCAYSRRNRKAINARRVMSGANSTPKERARLKNYRQQNPDRVSASIKRWQTKNPERMKAIAREMARRKRQNQSYVLKNRILCGIYRCLRGQRKTAPAFEILGCTPAELRTHLERQFLAGMGWHNANAWHIDHIVPLSVFNITGPDCPELRRAWALANLRPLWASDNLRKRDKRLFLL